MSRLNVDQIYTRTGTGSPTIREMPAFRAYASADQSISSNTPTKVNIDTVTGDNYFDTNGWFDTTNNRYTPQIAGYYFVTGIIRGLGSPTTRYIALLYKNGSLYVQGNTINVSGTSIATQINVSTTVYLNGTTDYIELYGTIIGTSPSFDFLDATATSIFEGFLVRAA